MDKRSKREVYIQTIRMRTLPAVLGPIIIAISIAINIGPKTAGKVLMRIV